MEVVWERLVDTPLEHVRHAVKPLRQHAQAAHSREDLELLLARRWTDLEGLCRILGADEDEGGGASGRASGGGGGANRSARPRLGSAVEAIECRKRMREDESEDDHHADHHAMTVDDPAMSVEERAEEERRVELMLVYAVRALLELGYSIGGTGAGGGTGAAVVKYLQRLVEKEELCGGRKTRGSRYSMATRGSRYSMAITLITELQANK
jgi:hypothetical protein